MRNLILIVCLINLGCSTVGKQAQQVPVVEKSTVETSINKDITFFTFDAACWIRDSSSILFYAENFSIVSATENLMGIEQEGRSDFLPTSCLLEAREKTLEVKKTDQMVDFNCFLGDDLVEGKNFAFVERLSPSLFWLVGEDGQNVVIPANICLIYPR